MDETLALPSEKAVKIALRTQQIIAYETGVTNTIDPLGGSYFVEALTDKTEREAEAYFEKIDALGGVIPGIEAGFFQREIAEAAYRYEDEWRATRDAQQARGAWTPPRSWRQLTQGLRDLIALSVPVIVLTTACLPLL